MAAAAKRRFIHWLALVAVAITGAAGQVSAQQAADNAAVIEAVMAAAAPDILQVVPSPTGTVEAVITVYPCVAVGQDSDMAYERLDIRETATGAITPVTEQVINCGGLGAYGLSIRRWTEDGRFLYFSDGREGTPDGAATGAFAPLWRLDVDEMRLEALDNGSIAPNGAWVALWESGADAALSLLPLSAEREAAQRVDLLPAGLSLASITWLPDSSGVLVIQVDDPNAPRASAVTYIDAAALEPRILLGN